MRKIAILVLGCASGIYPELIDTIKRTWGCRRIAETDIYYVFGRVTGSSEKSVMENLLGDEIPTIEDDGMYAKGDILIAGCEDSIYIQTDCILQKRLIAFDYLTSMNRYDFIYTVCAASYVDQTQLVDHVNKLPKGDCISGATSIDLTGSAPFVSGASMILSAEVATKLAAERAQVRKENTFGFRDDVAIGQWIADHLCDASRHEIMHAIANNAPQPEGSLFHPAPNTTQDFVLSGSSILRRRSGVFHYHFHSAEAKKLEAFHYRYFLN